MLFSIICNDYNAKIHLIKYLLYGVNLQRILINFSGDIVQVKSEWVVMLEVLRKDFWSFLMPEETTIQENISISISIFKSSERPVIPELVASMQTQNALTYDVGELRFCDYYGKAFTKVNFKKQEAEVVGVDFERIHEISYLLILSLAGKRMDLRGLHKLHAFAVSFNDIALVCMMPSKGGKSTLLAELLNDERIKMISDDIPLIDTFGHVRPFPLKLGVNELSPDLQVMNPNENIYSMKRESHGEKILVCTRGLVGKVESTERVFKNVILAEAFRFNSPNAKIIPMSWYKTMKGLFKHGILGIGSPMIIEYFWEIGWRDFLKKAKIFLMRCSAFAALCTRSKRIQIYSGLYPSQTAKKLILFLEESSNK